MSTPGQEATGEATAADLVIETASATAAEIAAATAVLSAALAEAADEGALPAKPRSDWEKGARAIRSPLGPGPGAWRTFSG